MKCPVCNKKMELMEVNKPGYFCLNPECPSKRLVYMCIECMIKGEIRK